MQEPKLDVQMLVAQRRLAFKPTAVVFCRTLELTGTSENNTIQK